MKFVASLMVPLIAFLSTNAAAGENTASDVHASNGIPRVDLEISGIRLGKTNNVFREELAKGREVGPGIWGVAVANATGTEVLTLLRYPGSYATSFDDAVLSRSDEVRYNLEPVRIKAVTSFKSGLGISLGMPEEKVKTALGGSYQTKDVDTQPGRTRIRYEIPLEKAPPELKEINMPLYYIDISFDAGKVDRYQIGFEMP